MKSTPNKPKVKGKGEKADRRMAKHYVFTDNGPKGGERREVKDWVALDWLTNPPVNKKKEELLQYLIVGMEISPTTGHPHGQGYLQLKSRARISTVKKMLNLPAVYLAQKSKHSSVQQCIDYVEKGPKGHEEDKKPAKDIYEFGEAMMGQGARTDITAAVKIIKEGGSVADVCREAPTVFVKYPGGFIKLHAVLKEEQIPKQRPVKVYLFYGKTGTGKTTTAMNYDSQPFSLKGYQLQKQYFCSYKGEKTLVVDEFAHQCKITFLLGILDVWKLELDIKYGSTWAEWETVFITTNLSYPDDFYPRALEEHRQALFRRITKAFCFEEPWVLPEGLPTPPTSPAPSEGEPTAPILERHDAMVIDVD